MTVAATVVVTAVLTQPAAATAEPVMAAGAVETEIDSDAGRASHLGRVYASESRLVRNRESRLVRNRPSARECRSHGGKLLNRRQHGNRIREEGTRVYFTIEDHVAVYRISIGGSLVMPGGTM